MKRGPARDAPNRLQRWLLCSAPIWLVCLVTGLLGAILPSAFIAILASFSLPTALYGYGVMSGCMTIAAAANVARTGWQSGRGDREATHL